MKNKKRWRFRLALGIVFGLLVAGVGYLSFQNGEDAKLLGKQVITKLAEVQYSSQEISENDMNAFTYMIRQNGRIIAFLLIGIVGTITIHVSCAKCNWLIRTCITAVILVAIAYLTEKLKIYIPTRHYSYEEMLVSMASAAAGFILVSAVTLTVKAVKGFFRLMAASHVS